MELKKIDSKEKSFEANGKRYFIESSLSIERYIAFQKIEVELAYGGGFLGVYQGLNKCIDLLNDRKWVDAAVLLVNTRDSIGNLDKKRIPALDMCGLFINEANEDRKRITDEMLLAKQADWEAEGIPADFFLTIAVNLVRGYKEVLKQGVSSTLTESKIQKNAPLD